MIDAPLVAAALGGTGWYMIPGFKRLLLRVHNYSSMCWTLLAVAVRLCRVVLQLQRLTAFCIRARKCPAKVRQKKHQRELHLWSREGGGGRSYGVEA